MRERLFAAIHKLEECGWRYDAELLVVLRKIAETEPPDTIEDILEAFR